MTRPEGWPIVSELSSPETWLGLRFNEREVEQDYQVWRREHVRAFAQVALYAATGAALCAWVAVLFGALDLYRTTSLVLIPLMIVLLFGGAALVRTERFAGAVT